MANDTLENPSIGGFSIENTMEMGMGNQELLNDLFSTESATGSPDDVEKIIKEIPKDKDKDKDKEEEKEEKEEKKREIIEDFFSEEEEEEEEGKIEEKKEISETEEKEEDDNRFTALSNDLFKLNVFNKEEGEEDIVISTPEDFLERFQVEKKKGAIEIVNNFIGQFGEDYQEAFQAIFVKGTDPKEYFSTYNNIADFSAMDLTKEENQVAIIKQALHDQGFEPEDVETEVERLRNYGDLESVSAKHHKVLVKREALKLQQIEQKAEQELQQKSAIKQQYITSIQTILQEKVKNKEFDGIPLSPKTASELQDFLLVDKYKTSSGETLTDFDKVILEMKRPENHAMKVKVALLLKTLEKDPTLSTIQKTGITKKSNQLFAEVVRQKDKSPIVNKEKAQSWFN